jgi:MFS family permease
LFVHDPEVAILLIILLEGLRSFSANLANPAWTALVADLVPGALRGRYFGGRNMAMGVAALIVTPLAGRIINTGNNAGFSDVLGFQLAFVLAFIFGLISTASFQRIEEPPHSSDALQPHHPGDLRRAIGQAPGYIGLVVSAFVFNLGLQVAAPFFNVYLVKEFQSTAAAIGLLAAVSSLTALIGQPIFGRLLDQRGAIWVQLVTGFMLPILPFCWIFVTAPWQVGLINTLGGFLWAGYNLASFNLLLVMTPDAQRPRAVALYQTAVFSSAVAGPLLGGYLADAVSFRLIFALSALGRLVATAIFAVFAVRPWRAAQRELVPTS